MKVIKGGCPAMKFRDGDPEAERKKLLAMIHIARKDMGWTDFFYRSLLENCFGVATAAALTDAQIESLIASIRNQGWEPKRNRGEIDEQIVAFRRRIITIAAQIPNGQERLKGLCKSLCGTESLNWCAEIPKMKRLLAALGNILRKEREAKAVS